MPSPLIHSTGTAELPGSQPSAGCGTDGDPPPPASRASQQAGAQLINRDNKLLGSVFHSEVGTQ